MSALPWNRIPLSESIISDNGLVTRKYLIEPFHDPNDEIYLRLKLRPTWFCMPLE